MSRSVRYVCITCVLLVCGSRSFGAPASAILETEARRIEVIDKAKDAVLAIFPLNGRGGGSGVVISPDGYALTNWHVVRPCGYAMQCGMADGRTYNAVLVGLDPTGDVALIKLFGREKFPIAEMADSDQVRPGDWVFAAGNPFLLATDFQPTISNGIISGVHRYQFPAGTLLEYADCLQTDASVNPGNSGGPLFDEQGRVIGINGRCSFEKRGRVNVGLAYAISINQIKNFLGTLRSGRIVDHATLGAVVSRDEDGRVIVTDILDDSDAYRRGLRSGDEIVSFDGRHITTPNAFKNVLGIYPKGWRVPLSFRRDGQRHDIFVRLAGVHNQVELLKKTGGGKRKPQLKPGEGPKKPSPGKKAKSAAQAGPAIPEIIEKHHKDKRGFSNFHYNELEQNRVWNAWNSRSNQADTNGAWTLTGPLTSGGRYTLKLTDDAAKLTLPSSEIDWKAEDVLSKSLLPKHSGGMLPALYLWRRLAVEGLGRFGDIYYYGTAPLVGREGLVDVLVGTHKGVDCRFYFDPADGRMLALEMFSSEDSDPCEIYFSDYRETGGRLMPGKMEVRFDDEPFATLKIERFNVEKQGEK